MGRSLGRTVFGVLLLIIGASQVMAKEIAIPALTGRVVDQAGILSSTEESGLSSRLAALESKTTIQLVVVTLAGLQSRTIEEWGLALGRGWGIGQAGKNNGVLLIVAPNERELRIEVGYGLEGDLPDATAHAIIQNVILPRFKAGDMPGGISDGVEAISRALSGEKVEFTSDARAFGSWFDGRWIPFLFIGGFWILVILRRFRGDDDDSAVFGGSARIGSGSRGGGFSWGGGFRGGGGSFGGGGASGRW